jgi:hypothetical protein
MSRLTAGVPALVARQPAEPQPAELPDPQRLAARLAGLPDLLRAEPGRAARGRRAEPALRPAAC